MVGKGRQRAFFIRLAGTTCKAGVSSVPSRRCASALQERKLCLLINCAISYLGYISRKHGVRENVVEKTKFDPKISAKETLT
jgi:hypothetical protein